MQRFPFILSSLLICFVLCSPLQAAVEVSWQGKPPVLIDEVYQQQGVSYLAADEVFRSLGLKAHWDSVKHLYSLQLSSGKASFYPGGRFLYLNGRSVAMEHPARFIDEKLRIPESFLTGVLPQLTQRLLVYRNLDPVRYAADSKEEAGLDRLFSLLLRQKRLDSHGPALSAVAIDPGHGGADPGVIALDGSKEKELNLQLAEEVKRRLRMQLGIPVYLTRDGDYLVEQHERFATTTRSGADLYLVIHSQISPSAEKQGIMLFIRQRSVSEGNQGERDESLQLAGALRESLMQDGWHVDPVRAAPLLPLGQGNLPTVLMEVGFLSNRQDLQTLHDPTEQARLAKGIETGLVEYAKRKKQQESLR